MADKNDDGCVVRVRIGGVDALLVDIPLESVELPDCLTDAERDVVTLVLEGRSNDEIAKLRNRSYRTIANQLAAIYRKLHVANRTELVARLAPRAASHSLT